MSAMPDGGPGSRKQIPIQPVGPEGESLEQSLYEVRKKIYPRAVNGLFARWRWGFVIATQVVFYGLAWLPWNDRQAVLFDLAARKFYVFGLVLWPQDFIYLTALLVISALSLFLFTAVAGRVWCGYACPQTVYTEIFMWVERVVEGERGARMKLDAAGTSAAKIGKKAAKHAIWAAIGLWTGITFVGYFTPIRDLVFSVARLELGPWEWFWTLFYGFATYGNAGWMREQVCKYMCPYARFQSAMFDQDTLVISYDRERGEPRGSRGRKADYKAAGLGACVDCNICVQVCPTGIDIREGLQYECIGCALCIDGCDQVMDKMGYPRGLIRYTSERAMKEHARATSILAHLARPRVIVYTVILGIVAGAAGGALWHRQPMKMDVIRDRASIAREIEDGRIENVYRLQIMNTLEVPRRFRLDLESDKLDHAELLVDPRDLEIAPTQTKEVTVRVRADATSHRGSRKIEFELETTDGERPAKLKEHSRFLIP